MRKVAQFAWSMHKPKVVARWWTNAFAGHSRYGFLVHGLGCSVVPTSECRGYCHCWCHGPVGAALDGDRS